MKRKVIKIQRIEYILPKEEVHTAILEYVNNSQTEDGRYCVADESTAKISFKEDGSATVTNEYT